VWLADHQPELWQRMTLIDRQLERLEQRNAEAAEYESVLSQLIKAVQQARRLYEQERSKKAVNQ
jgi:type II secretory pathway component PulJ